MRNQFRLFFISAFIFLFHYDPGDASGTADSILVFNEVYYNPADDLSESEWIEFHNLNGVNVDVSGWRLRGGVEFDFPQGTVVDGHGFILIAADPDSQNLSGKSALGPFQGSLSNGGESLRIEDRDGRVMDTLVYNDGGDWPVGPDGSGVTLAKRNQETANSDPDNWVAARYVGGTPGLPNFPLPGAPPVKIETIIVSWDSVWRYNETDDFDSGWASLVHSVGGNWKPGTGLLGWDTSPPEVPLGTELQRPLLNDPYVITYYFEHDFNLSQTQIDNLSELKIEHLFDDGGIVYINGQEAFRHKMPEGNISSETLAERGTDPDLEDPVGIPATALAVGPNRISVEVHQANSGSSDIMFGLRLTLVEEPPDPSVPKETLVFNEFSSYVAEGGFLLEMRNLTSASIPLTDYQIVFSEGDIYTIVEGTLVAGKLKTLSEKDLGFSPGNNDRIFLFDPSGQLIDARKVTGKLRGRSEEFNGEWLYPSLPTFGDANKFSFERDVVINEIMYHPRPEPEVPDTEAIYDSTTLLDWGATWRYNESGPDLGGSWQDRPHAVGGDWKIGIGPLGWDSTIKEIPARTIITRPSLNPAAPVIAYYFEADLNLTQNDIDEIVALKLVHLIDDGAVFYINGQEVNRFKMPDGIINSDTRASSGGEAEIEGQFNISKEVLLVGLNRISASVHQSSPGSSDIIFGMQLLAEKEVSPFVPGKPFRSSDRTWVEIHNRNADRTINLTGWSFDDGFEFNFSEDTILSPGEFIVLSEDSDELRGQHPDIRILGGMKGRLSRSGERIKLIDSHGNPVDEVHYFDGGRWPGKADGGGSSLELRNPYSNNKIPESWSASNEFARGKWKSFVRTGRAVNGRSDPQGYHEFIFGLIDEGEILIDDISVIESPGTGSSKELIQNGDFSSGTASSWRMRGTQRHFNIVEDPDFLGNKVMRLKASGPTEHMHNCAETTLKSGNSYANISSSKEYKISFRARWISGSNQLNSRLYFNRLPRTDILPIEDPNGGGTPGRANSVFEENLGPTFDDPIHDPAVPEVNQVVEVSAVIEDPEGVDSVVVHYSVNSGSFRQVPMIAGPNGIYRATIPGQSKGSRAQFYIEAIDSLGAKSFFPKEAKESRAMIPWDDDKSKLRSGSVYPTNLRIVMPIADGNFMHNVTEVMSNDRLPCTVIHNDEIIYYGCSVRLKSSQRGRSNEGRVGFNIKFPANNKFLGAHGTVAVDRSSQREIMIKHIVTRAGKIPSMYDDIAWVIQPRSNRATSGILMKSRYDDEWLENAIPDGNDGRMFEFELIYYPNGTNGGKEGLKLPQPDGVVGVQMRNQGGDDKELYRWHWLIKNNRDADDYSGLINLLDTLGLSGSAYRDSIENIVDVDQWLRSFAVQNLGGIGDNYSTHGSGAWHNAIFYIRPTDGKAMYFPWDMDFTFTNSATSGVTPSTDLNKLISIGPRYERAYYGHLLDIIETAFNSDYMSPWLRHYSDFLSSDNLNGNSGYIRSRSNHVRNLISNAVSKVPFRVISNSGTNTNKSTISVRGDAWVDVREIRLEGTDDGLGIRWLDDNSWEVNLPVRSGLNNYRLEGVGFGGEIIGSANYSINGNGAVEPAGRENLAISEIHYHPNPPSKEETDAGFTDSSMFEWIELVNISDSDKIDLSNVHFVSGINYSIPSGTLLDPGKRIVIPSNFSAFVHRYGDLKNGTLLSHSFLDDQGNNKLSNAGERVLLYSADNVTVADFSYKDDRPWPVSADGNGYSLTLMMPGTNNPSLAQSWRSSLDLGGTPGSTDVIPILSWLDENGGVELLNDVDGDGRPALIEYLENTDPLKKDSTSTIVELGEDGELRIEFLQAIGHDQIYFYAQSSANFNEWQAEEVKYRGRVNNGDGTETVRFRIDNSISSLGRNGFLRLVVSEDP
ncbi:MAG: lamin tail domain-containing protein [Verrucomicrobiales bacterium]|nr:lamin tail domain-containing protein [Verrucomicrobiales bacterium]